MEAFYDERTDSLQRQLTTLDRQLNLLSRWRGWVFLGTLAMAFAAWSQLGPAIIFYPLAAVGLIAFLAIAARYEAAEEELKIVRTRLWINRRQQARAARNWDAVSGAIHDSPEDVTAVAADLDLMGRRSLFQLVCRAHTAAGIDRLTDWLCHPAAISEIVRRQEVIQHLAPLTDWRETFELHGRMLASARGRAGSLAQWLHDPNWLASRPWIFPIVSMLTLILVAVPLLVFTALVPAEFFVAFYLALVASVIFNALFAGSVHDIFNRITTGKNELLHHLFLFEFVAELPSDIPLIRDIQQPFCSGTTSYRDSLARLRRLARFSSGRCSGVWWPVYIIAQLVMFWDFHVLARLEFWKRQHGEAALQWFQSVGDVEALASLASVAYDHPDWTYPRVEAENTRVVGKGVGHPLLPPAQCVRNDVVVGPRGRLLLVTGSNMSGKSTLLRALGVNIALAQAGAPVCASDLSLPSLELATSMRITDSLADGVSFFMAELKRLKEIVDHAAAWKNSRERSLFFLLDEILLGTNSRERHIAVERVLQSLLRDGAFGAISTHDLDLADSPILKDRCQVVHFQESIVNVSGTNAMTFDYLLRDGIAPTTNALKLLELVGLGGQES